MPKRVPDPAPRETTDAAPSSSSYPWLSAGCWIAVALALVVARSPSTFTDAQFWAEDGSVFFTQADQMGTKALWLPHAGYHHFAMRLWAGLAVGAGLPVVMLPTVFVAGGLLAWLAVALTLFSPQAGWRWPGLMLLALVVVPPTHEVWFNLTNAQWTLALLWPLWWWAREPQTKAGATVRATGMAVVGLTGVFSILAAPLMLARVAWRRSWTAALAAAVCVVTAWIQLKVALADAAGGAGTGRAWGAGEAALVLGKRMAGMLFLPATVSGGWMAGVGLALLLAIWVWWGWRAWAKPELRPLGGWLVLGLAVGGAALLRFPDGLKPLLGGFNGDRYFWVPKVLLVWSVVQLAARGGRWERWTGAVALLVVLAVAVPRLRLPALPDNDWPRWAARIEAGEETGWVPITPKGMRFYYPGNAERKR